MDGLLERDFGLAMSWEWEETYKCNGGRLRVTVVGDSTRVAGGTARGLGFSGAALGTSGAVSRMSQHEETYDDGRARNLEALLRALAGRILELDRQGKLLDRAGVLMRLIGDVRSELFHYEVRATYDTPEIAESRRIVSEALQDGEATWEATKWKPDEDAEKQR